MTTVCLEQANQSLTTFKLIIFACQKLLIVYIIKVLMNWELELLSFLVQFQQSHIISLEHITMKV